MAFQPQLDLFREIWLEREHKSIVSGTPLYFDVQCFAHVLGKGSYPGFKLKKENIVLMTPPEHHVYDARTDLARTIEGFDKVFELADKLRTEYHEANQC